MLHPRSLVLALALLGSPAPGAVQAAPAPAARVVVAGGGRGYALDRMLRRFVTRAQAGRRARLASR